MPPRHLALLLPPLLLAACQTDLTLPTDVRLTCSAASPECPDGFGCLVELGRCVSSQLDDFTDPTVVGDPVVTGGSVRQGAVIEAVFSVSETLLVAPAVQLAFDGGDTAVDLQPAETGSDGGTGAADSYSLSHHVTGEEPEALATVTARLIDLVGNENVLELGQVRLDFTPPVVDHVEVTGGTVHDGETWVDQLDVSLAVEATDEDRVAAVAVSGDVAEPTTRELSETVAVSLSASDGPKTLLLRLNDAAGNESEATTVQLRLDRATPSSPIVIDQPSPSPAWLNQDAVIAFFHTEGEPPADLLGYVVSTDGGSTWTEIGRDGRHTLDPLPQNTVTELLVAERDLFGNDTPPEGRGRLEIHEDSLPPHVRALAVDGAVPFKETAWVDTSTLVLAADVGDDSEPGVVGVAIDGDVAEPEERPFEAGAPLEVALSEGDGPKVVVVRFLDAAGNGTERRPAVWLDQAPLDNGIVIDDPEESPVHLDRDRLVVLFHSDGDLPPDFQTYVASHNDGEQWLDAGPEGRFTIPMLAQDATTEVLLAERDVFGNQTPAEGWGRLTLHEDSRPPRVRAVAVEGATVLGNDVWVDTPSIRFLVDVEDPDGSGVQEVEVTGDVAAPRQDPYAAGDPIDVELTGGDGPKVIRLRFADAALNVAESRTFVLLDTSPLTNAVVIDVPGESPIWVNQDGLTVIFHSEGDLPPDFLTYVLSKDGGDTWVEIGRRGPVAVALEENTTVEVLLREKDVFGELTPEELQARLVVHEDSLRPSAPELTQDVVVADISTRAGVLLATPSSDPGGGPVSYELFGGARDRFESVGEDPWFELPGIPLDEGTMFLVRAVDRAGNTSETRSVVVANNSLRQQADAGFGCRPWPCLWRVLPAVRDGKAVYRECWNCDHSPRYALFACAASPAGQAYCEQLGVLDRNPSSVDVFGRYVAYLSNDDPPDDGLVLEDLGPDERPGGEPGQGSTVLGGGARCPALASQGLVYVAGDGRLRLRTFGADGVHGTGDAGEGDVPLPVAATIPDRCRVRFNGRHVVWLEDADNEGFDVRLYDLGPDRQPGSPDDPAADATLIGTGYPQQETVAEEVLLDGQRLHALNRLLDAGPDGVFATGDDVSWELPGAHSLSGDKVLLGNRGDWLLYDVSTGESLGLRDDGYVSGTIDSAGLGGSLLFAMYVPSPGDGFPSSLGLLDPPLGFALPEPASAGAVSGGLAWLRRSGDVAERLVNLRSGGLWRPDPAESLDDWGEELDLDGGRLVYRDGAGRILLFDAGADATPGTDDDVGPAEVAPAGRWPRLSGDVVVWADLAGDADGLWHGADLVSRIRGLRLGDDGLPGTADDEPLQVTDGGREVFPEVADGRVLWLDLRNDPDGRCPLDDKDQVDPAQCETDVFARTLPDGDERVLDDGPGPAVGLQADGELAVWLASSDGELWQPRVAAGDDAPTAAAEPASVLTGVATDGTRVGWWSDGPVVVDPGPDGRFGTADDRTLLEDVGDVPDEWGMPTRPTFPVADEHGGPFGRPRHRWFEGEVVLSEDHLYDLDLVAPDVRTSGAVDLPIPDGSPEGAVSSLEVPAPDYERVHDLRVDVVLEHPAPSELLVLLVSPSGDAALLYDGARPRGADPARTLTLETSPALLDHYREPLAGTWTLRVVDRAPGGEGVLRSWRLSHLP